MALITLRNICLSYGGPLLLDHVDLRIEAGERVCLVGRNGAGKTSLLRLIAGAVEPDSGEVMRRHGAAVGLLPQEIPSFPASSVFEVVASGLGDLGELVRRYHQLGRGLSADSDQRQLARLAAAQQDLEACGGWQLEQRAETVISRLALDPDAPFVGLSGGQQRRVLLARALVREPELLLLDEPTNHLDIETIDWMEEFLLGYRGALLFITHDRFFLRRLATRILELDRGRLTDWPGDYDNYLRRRAERLHAENLANERFDRRLSESEAWIRQGIKARRTRNQGRVRELEAMREERRARREQLGRARIRLNGAERSGRLVVEAEGIGHAWGDQVVIRDFSTLILRGDKVGILGPNGVGKSTLLKLLLGELPPDSGAVRLGTNLQIAYFDQLRTQLDMHKSVQDNVGGGSDQVTVNGRSKHVLSYLRDFLFTADRARQPLGALSGGERNRVLLATLFTRPANLLVLDEPTNDLDAETLELLEELLLDFTGTLLLVSHDRALLDHVVTSCLVFEGEGRVNEYVGGYGDWLRQRTPSEPKAPRSERRQGPDPLPAGIPSKPPTGKLSYKDQRELDGLPARIEALEAEQESLHAQLADPAFYRREGEVIAAATQRLEQVERELEQGYARWEALETVKGGG